MADAQRFSHGKSLAWQPLYAGTVQEAEAWAAEEARQQQERDATESAHSSSHGYSE